jgi:hypothetical protein
VISEIEQPVTCAACAGDSDTCECVVACDRCGFACWRDETAKYGAERLCLDCRPRSPTDLDD